MISTLRKILGSFLDVVYSVLKALRRPKPISAYIASILYMIAMFFIGELNGWGGLAHIVWMATAIPFFWVWTVLTWRWQDRIKAES